LVFSSLLPLFLKKVAQKTPGAEKLPKTRPSLAEGLKLARLTAGSDSQPFRALVRPAFSSRQFSRYPGN
jgi:hypothetical protein